MAFVNTPNKSLYQVTVGTEVGTWGPFVNNNPGILDNVLGGVTVVPLVAANVILSSAQYQCNFITFTGALAASVTITFPPVGSFYTVQNLTTNTSNFQVTLVTTVAGGQQIGTPWGEAIDIMTDGTNVKYRNLGRVGSYWDHAGSSTPAWVNNCTIPPYLYCNGSTFSSATYPVLATIFGGNTLPDFRGRAPAYLNDGTGRITSGSGGVDGNTLFAAGGNQTITLSSLHIPNYDLPVTDPGHHHAFTKPATSNTGVIQGGGGNFVVISSAVTSSDTTGISVNSGGGGNPFSLVQPTAMSGIRLVRAA